MQAVELISLESLKAKVSVNLDSLMLIEASKEETFLVPFEQDFDEEIILPLGFGFTAKASVVFKVRASFSAQVEGDVKALVHFVSGDIYFELDLVELDKFSSEGDWSHTSTSEVSLSFLSLVSTTPHSEVTGSSAQPATLENFLRF